VQLQRKKPRRIQNLRDALDSASAADGKPYYLTITPAFGSIWLIEGLPDDFFVTFNFDGFADTANGPFSSFALSPPSVLRGWLSQPAW
jgi:hypothetical protein